MPRLSLTCIISASCAFHCLVRIPPRRSTKDKNPLENPTAIDVPSSVTHRLLIWPRNWKEILKKISKHTLGNYSLYIGYNRPYRLFILPNGLVSMFTQFSITSSDRNYIPMFSRTELFLVYLRLNNKVVIQFYCVQIPVRV